MRLVRELIMVEDCSQLHSSSATCGAAQASSTSLRSARSSRLASSPSGSAWAGDGRGGSKKRSRRQHAMQCLGYFVFDHAEDAAQQNYTRCIPGCPQVEMDRLHTQRGRCRPLLIMRHPICATCHTTNHIKLGDGHPQTHTQQPRSRTPAVRHRDRLHTINLLIEVRMVGIMNRL